MIINEAQMTPHQEANQALKIKFHCLVYGEIHFLLQFFEDIIGIPHHIRCKHNDLTYIHDEMIITLGVVSICHVI